MVSNGYSNKNNKDKKGRIKVAVRLRPPLPKEKNLKSIIEIIDEKLVVVLDPAKVLEKEEFLRAKRSREKRYAFDYAFGNDASQKQVFSQTVQPVLDSVLEGYNVSVFAYGATGSGKTHTMLGTVEHPGLMFLTMKDLFDRVENTKKDFKYRVVLSYLEVYNENIRDLLHPSDEYLELREDSDKMHVVGLSEVEVTNEKQIMTLLRRGNKNRVQEPTHLNETSSRSHAVLQVTIEQSDRSRNTVEEVRVAKLSLIDLAGSERAAASHNRGIRLLEGANINRSLLALGNCINALGHRNNAGGYIPYRDSKLTRLLKDSLGGNCRTVMIATLSPSHLNMEDTVNTLKYANRAKHIKTKVTRNIVSVNHHVVHYTNIINDLRDEVSNLKKKLIMTRERSKRDLEAVNIGTSEEFHKVKRELVLNFEEMMQARKSMAELEALEVENRININRIQLIISDANCNISQIKKYKKELSTLVLSMKRNAKMKNEFIMKYNQLEDLAMALKEKLKSSAQSNCALQESLSHLFRLHLVELQNTELTAIQNKQNDLLRERDTEIQRLRMQLRQRDVVIYEQRKKMLTYGIHPSEIPSEFQSTQDSELLTESSTNPSTSPAPSVSSNDESTQSAPTYPSQPSTANSNTSHSNHVQNNINGSSTVHNNNISTAENTINNNNINIQFNSKQVYTQMQKKISGNIHPSQKLKAKRLKRQRLALIYGASSGKSNSKKSKKKKKKSVRRSTPVSQTSPYSDSLFVSRFAQDFNEIYSDVLPSEKTQKLSRKPRNLEQHERLLKHRQKRARKNFHSPISTSFEEPATSPHRAKYAKRNSVQPTSDIVVSRFPPLNTGW